MKKYHQRSKNERYIIFEKIQAGLSIKTIAGHLKVHFSTIYREIKRNSMSGDITQMLLMKNTVCDISIV